MKNKSAFKLILCLAALPLFAVVTGCASNRYTQSSSELSDDHATSSRVKAALSDDADRKFYEGVNVETFKNVVQLSGFVNTQALKERAGEIAKHAAGGRDVRNNITLK